MLRLRSEKILYQVRVPGAMSPVDVVTDLTQAAWRAMLGLKSFGGLDSHRWPSVYLVFRQAFQKRLVHYAGCGELPECSENLRSVYENTPPRPGVTFTLELNRPLAPTVRSLAVAVMRQVRDAFPRSSPNRLELLDDVEGAIHLALRPYIYYSAACGSCPLARRPGDRHVLADALWGAA